MSLRCDNNKKAVFKTAMKRKVENKNIEKEKQRKLS